MAGFLSTGPNTDSWLTEAQEVFSDKDLTQLRYTPSFGVAFRELTQTYKDQIAAWWEVQCLENYIKNNIVPRGLRINLTPSSKFTSSEFRTKWEQEATKSSLRLMNLLVEEARKVLEGLNTKWEHRKRLRIFSLNQTILTKKKTYKSRLKDTNTTWRTISTSNSCVTWLTLKTTKSIPLFHPNLSVGIFPQIYPQPRLNYRTLTATQRDRVDHPINHVGERDEVKNNRVIF